MVFHLMSSFALLLLWVCCTAQQVPVYQEGQMAFDGLVNLLTDPEIPESCGPPPQIDNGMLIAHEAQQYLSGSVVFYQCYRLYVMEGTPKARCINGRWRSVPRCLQTCRADESDMARNNIQLRWITKSTSMRASDYWMEFECKPGFDKDPSSPPFTKQCVKGLWIYPRCI